VYFFYTIFFLLSEAIRLLPHPSHLHFLISTLEEDL